MADTPERPSEDLASQQSEQPQDGPDSPTMEALRPKVREANEQSVTNAHLGGGL